MMFRISRARVALPDAPDSETFRLRFDLLTDAQPPHAQARPEGGATVGLYGDLKRHHMGRHLADEAGPQPSFTAALAPLKMGEEMPLIDADEFLTAELDDFLDDFLARRTGVREAQAEFDRQSEALAHDHVAAAARPQTLIEARRRSASGMRAKRTRPCAAPAQRIHSSIRASPALLQRPTDPFTKSISG